MRSRGEIEMGVPEMLTHADRGGLSQNMTYADRGEGGKTPKSNSP